MQFYKISGELITSETNENEKKTRKEIAHKIAAKTAEFNGANNTRYCFLSDLGEEYVTMGIIATQSMDLVAFAESYVKHIGLNAKVELPDEVTFGNLQNLLSNADRQSYIEDDNAILERFGLDRISGRRGRGLEFGENLVNYAAKEDELFASAKKLFTNETLVPELERIYAGSKYLYTSGHPVHYIVEADDRDVRREIYKVLLDALYANLRLENCRYSFLDFRPGENYSRMTYEALYKISEGGAVVVRYLASDDSEDDSNASSERDVIENICEMAKRYRNKVLTVLCFPREFEQAKMNQASRLLEKDFEAITTDEITTITADDIVIPEATKPQKRRIGFC